VKVSSALSVILMVVFLLAPAAWAHVPIIAAGNENISLAAHISDPGKSWAIYGFLGPNETQYYSFDRGKGEQIYLSLLKSSDVSEKDFRPEMALLGPQVKTAGVLPDHVVLPQMASASGILIIFGKALQTPPTSLLDPAALLRWQHWTCPLRNRADTMWPFMIILRGATMLWSWAAERSSAFPRG